MKENWFINLWLDLTYRFNQSFAIKSVQWACSYFLVKCDKFSKPLISTMLIPLDDHICIIFYLTGILVEECLLTFNKILRANIIFKKNISCVKSCPDHAIFVLSWSESLFLWYQFQDHIFLPLDPVGLIRYQRSEMIWKRTFSKCSLSQPSKYLWGLFYGRG